MATKKEGKTSKDHIKDSYELYVKKQKSISHKLATALVTLVLVFLINSLVVFSFYLSLEHDAAVIDAAGRQRMLSQKIGLYAQLARGGNLDPLIEMRESADLHKESLIALRDGGVAPGIYDNRELPPTSETVYPILREAEAEWNKYELLINTLYFEDFSDDSSSLEINRILQEIEREAPILLEKNDNLVKAYVDENLSKKRQFLVIIIVILVLDLIVSLGFYFYLKDSLVNPIKKLLSATSRIKSGDYTKKVSLNTKDEMEDLANMINKTAETLENMKSRHNQLEKAKTEFISITSHELRSPMTPMKAQLQMMLEGYLGKINPKQRDALDIILRNAERLDRIILDFLEISRIEAARLKFNFKKADLLEYAKNVVKEMDGHLPEKNIQIVTDFKKIPEIEVDPDRVMQVLRNLLNNAKKFSKDNSTIRVTIRQVNDQIVFSVKDAGIGISYEDQPRIFEPFFQAEQTIFRKYSGNGLGLAICKGIVESQEGKIWFESNPGKGTTFFFTVPLSPVKEGKSIKVLFSAKSELYDRLSHYMFENLGPMAETELGIVNRTGLTFDNFINYINELEDNGILDFEKSDKMRREARLVFGSKKNYFVAKNASREIRNLYYEFLGPLGEIYFNRLEGNISLDGIKSQINYLCKKNIIEKPKAEDMERRVSHALSRSKKLINNETENNDDLEGMKSPEQKILEALKK